MGAKVSDLSLQVSPTMRVGLTRSAAPAARSLVHLK
jgi:hypothetical protein